MSQIGLSVNNQFNPIDILTMSNFSRIREMLDETMHSEVSEKFEKIAGGKSQKSTYLTQLKDHDRYIYYADQGQWFWIGLGYWFNSKNIKPYPELGLIIEVPPKLPERNVIISAFKQLISESAKWEGANLDNPTAWASIRLTKTLQSFLSSENHIQEIKTYFAICIEAVAELKIRYPEIP